MKVLADSDLILEFFLKRREDYFSAADELLLLFECQQVELYLTDICIKKIQHICGSEIASFLMKQLKGCIIRIEQDMGDPMNLPLLDDPESAIEVMCAVKNKLDAIISQRPENYTGASLPILSVQQVGQIASEQFRSQLETLYQLDKSYQPNKIIETTLKQNKKLIAEAMLQLQETSQNSVPKLVKWLLMTGDLKEEITLVILVEGRENSKFEINMSKFLQEMLGRKKDSQSVILVQGRGISQEWRTKLAKFLSDIGQGKNLMEARLIITYLQK
ncbi:PIN domain-containing protein [Nostoc sp. 'Peltigera membranacea cyanobiont' N6]|uniref:PIN domain-containing protein n=1 Tax=Nostoc sp. 'Peltigera membranacea cyanobiont' N6 TaxID=1261031 RepID=UPI000CF317D6|nr:PIN domain-containing protein [Nostoc sp. 'Peltigera membranacea cyanobiont' N6]AVH68541.1 hypothetical protein NPM_60027 [Nostoc sp. 'Peltigera membranacea cyanobiont' N6]